MSVKKQYNKRNKLQVIDEKQMKEVDQKQTKRAKTYESWIKEPNPMVTFFKILDVTSLVKKQFKI